MSDIWEEYYGFSSADDGTLYPEQAPNADADGDGFSNLQEAEAGTDPQSGAQPEGYLSAVVVRNTEFSEFLSVTWHGVAGKLYELKGSPDLGVNWVSAEDPVIGTGGTITVNIAINGLEAAPPFFWRVEVGDIDEDGDGLTSADEVLIGTDDDGDGLTILQEYEKGTDPLLMDTDGDGIPDDADLDPLDPDFEEVEISGALRILTPGLH